MTLDSLSSGALGVTGVTVEEMKRLGLERGVDRFVEEAIAKPFSVSYYEYVLSSEIVRLRASLAAVSEERDRLEKDHRLWALDNVARLPKRRECQCYRDDCVDCAKEIGRRIGHVEAGARESHEDAMRMLREFIAESRAALPVVEEPSE